MNDTAWAAMPPEPAAPTAEGFIPLCVPEIRGNEWRYLKECLDTNWVSSAGPFVDRFERMVAEYLGTSDAVATVNGTAALHIALLVAGVEPEDEVLVSALSFIAPANAIRYVGAWPVFIDAQPDSWQIDPQRVVAFLQEKCRWHDGTLYNKATGRRVRAILPVHILGHPVDIDPILEVARRFDVVVIEDASEGLGAKYKGRMVGHLGDIACLSFNGNKIITTGGGGMIATDNETWARRARYLTTQAKDDPVEFVHGEIGYNYRMTNVEAALGCAQLEQIDEYIAAKRRIAAAYTEALNHIPGLSTIREASWATSSFWMFTALVDEEQYGLDSRSLLRELAQIGIQSRPLWQPLHRSPAHSKYVAFHCDVAEGLYREALSLPCSVGVIGTDQERVIHSLRVRARGSAGAPVRTPGGSS